MGTGWQMNHDAHTGQVTVQQQMQMFNPESGGMDIVVGGEITASVAEWHMLVEMLVQSFGPPPPRPPLPS